MLLGGHKSAPHRESEFEFEFESEFESELVPECASEFEFTPVFGSEFVFADSCAAKPRGDELDIENTRAP